MPGSMCGLGCLHMGTSGEGKSCVQLLVVYYEREQFEQRVEREFQQRQREQQQ
jgi:hypothetical protein